MSQIHIPRYLCNLSEKWGISTELWGRLLVAARDLPSRSPLTEMELTDLDGNPTGQWESLVQLVEDGILHSFRCVFTKGDVWTAIDLQHCSASVLDIEGLNTDDISKDVFGE